MGSTDGHKIADFPLVGLENVTKKILLVDRNW